MIIGQKLVKQKQRKEVQEFREKDKTIKQLIADAKKPFQHFIRLRDAKLPCISCGTINAKIVDGGHFYKAELYTGLIFNEDNCHKQCRKCNTFLGGNENNYRLGLIDRYGIDFVLNLDELSLISKTYKFERSELVKIKEYYKQKIKEWK
jgi:hypothetical protein